MEKVRNILSFDGSGIGFRWELKNLKPIDQSFFRGWLSWEHPYGNKDNYVLPEETVKRMPGHEFVENKDAEGGSKGSDFFKHYVYALNALVLIDNGLDVGLLGFAIEKSSKDLNEPIIKVITFYILPEYRNQGYGKQMQKMFVDYVQKNYPGLEIHGNIQTDVGEHMVNYRHNLLKDKSKHIITDSRKTGDSGKAELYSFPKQNMNLSWDVPDIEVENPITLYNGYTTDYSRCWISPMGDNFDALDDHTKSAIPLILKFYPNYEEEASGIMDAGNSEYNVKPQEYLLNKGWVRSNLQEGVIYFEVWNKGVIGNQKGFIIEFLR
ncbi:MAG: GNAT family N-acetyltransferase, partial [Synergistaceae bacterium]|nr:GNAT family N-acetyltransferase [Synergistaceae bacterium]